MRTTLPTRRQAEKGHIMHTHLSRADLLASAPMYDRHRDGPDALVVGTRTPTHTYTGGTVIGTVDLSRERELFAMRTGTSTAPEWMQAVWIAARERVATHADKYDWDCHKCQTAVMTDTLEEPCPNCLL